MLKLPAYLYNVLRLNVYICMGVCCLFFRASAQDAHPAFKQYTVENGLASSEVYQVKQDSKGYIWFATGNGVSRFNGYEFENFAVSDGLPDNTVFDIFEDKTGKIWFVPLSCKLSYYSNGKIYPYQYNDALQKALVNPIKTSFYTDGLGTVYLGVFREGIFMVSPGGKVTLKKTNPGCSKRIYVVEPAQNQMVYAGMEHQCKNNEKFEPYSEVDLDIATMKKSISIAHLGLHYFRASARFSRLRNGDILFYSNEKVGFINPRGECRFERLGEGINSIYEDHDGDLWLGMATGGVYHVKNHDFKTKKNYLGDMRVTGVLQDNEDGFWFTTDGNGVFYSPSKHVLAYDASSGLGGSNINCLTVNGEALICGLQNGFMHTIYPGGHIESHNLNLLGYKSNEIGGLLYNNITGYTVVGSNEFSAMIRPDGKFRLMMSISCSKAYDNKWFSLPQLAHIVKTDSCARLKKTVFLRMLPYNDDTMLYGYPHSLAWQIRDNYVSVVDTKFRRRINALAYKDKHTVYMGAIDGLWQYHIPSGTFARVDTGFALLQERILDLAFGPDSILVMGTKGMGLMLYTGKKLYRVNSAHGLGGDNVYRLLCSGRTIWAGTNKGLTKITVTQTNPVRYTLDNFTTADGLVYNEIKDIAKSDGKIWVATTKGLSFFDENVRLHKSFELPLLINHIYINEKDTAIKAAYSLPHDYNNIKINFTALGYKHAGHLQYRYKMEGLDTGWQYTRNREIQYTTLPPAQYVFILAVQNADGRWSARPLRMAFRIQAPFWQKWWIMLLAILLTVYLTRLMLKRRFKKTQEQKEIRTQLDRDLMNLKLKALRAQMNPHFIFNVMNSIQHFIAHRNSEAANRYLSKFSRLVRVILQNSGENAVPLAEEIKALELYLELEAMRFDDGFTYTIHTDPSLDINKIQIPSMLIQPYVENAILHGILPLGGRGHVSIDIQNHVTHLTCSIQDNGIGRKKAAENSQDAGHRSFGTFITKERLTLINQLYQNRLSENIIDLKNAAGEAAGTRVEILIPLLS